MWQVGRRRSASASTRRCASIDLPRGRFLYLDATCARPRRRLRRSRLGCCSCCRRAAGVRQDAARGARRRPRLAGGAAPAARRGGGAQDTSRRPGVDISKLDDFQKKVFFRIVNSRAVDLRPGAEPDPVGEEGPNCRRSLNAVRYVARLVEQGFTDSEVSRLADQALPRRRSRKKLDVSEAPMKGNANAKVTLVEFADYECPHCKRFQPVLRQILDEFHGEVKLYFKHYPLPQHTNARLAAEAATAAQKQGKFWPYEEKLWANQDNLTPAELEKYAKETGLDVDEVPPGPRIRRPSRRACRRTASKGRPPGLSRRPTLFINGREYTRRQATPRACANGSRKSWQVARLRRCRSRWLWRLARLRAPGGGGGGRGRRGGNQVGAPVPEMTSRRCRASRRRLVLPRAGGAAGRLGVVVRPVQAGAADAGRRWRVAPARTRRRGPGRVGRSGAGERRQVPAAARGRDSRRLTPSPTTLRRAGEIADVHRLAAATKMPSLRYITRPAPEGHPIALTCNYGFVPGDAPHHRTGYLRRHLRRRRAGGGGGASLRADVRRRKRASDARASRTSGRRDCPCGATRTP